MRGTTLSRGAHGRTAGQAARGTVFRGCGAAACHTVKWGRRATGGVSARAPPARQVNGRRDSVARRDNGPMRGTTFSRGAHGRTSRPWHGFGDALVDGMLARREAMDLGEVGVGIEIGAVVVAPTAPFVVARLDA